MDVVDLAWDDDAWDAFTAQAHADPERYRRLYAVLARLAVDPQEPRLRRRRYHDPPLFAVALTSTAQEWLVLWNLADDGVAQVWYVGPAPT